MTIDMIGNIIFATNTPHGIIAAAFNLLTNPKGLFIICRITNAINLCRNLLKSTAWICMSEVKAHGIQILGFTYFAILINIANHFRIGRKTLMLIRRRLP